jgi:hypothetical protein
MAVTFLSDGRSSIDTQLACEILYTELGFAGPRSSVSGLSVEQCFDVLLECDGFGQVDSEWLIDYFANGWDWSHVRDSTPDALASALRKLTKHLHANRMHNAYFEDLEKGVI